MKEYVLMKHMFNKALHVADHEASLFHIHCGFMVALGIPKHMHFIVRQFYCENIAVHFHVTPHALVINIILQAFRDLCGVFC